MYILPLTLLGYCYANHSFLRKWVKTNRIILAWLNCYYTHLYVCLSVSIIMVTAVVVSKKLTMHIYLVILRGGRTPLDLVANYLHSLIHSDSHAL